MVSRVSIALGISAVSYLTTVTFEVSMIEAGVPIERLPDLLQSLVLGIVSGFLILLLIAAWRKVGGHREEPVS